MIETFPNLPRDEAGKHAASQLALVVDASVRGQLFEATRSIGKALERHADASPDVQACAIFNSYDFHLCDEGLKLIEVNTNAGGGFIVHSLIDDADHRLDPGCRWPQAVDSPVSQIFECWRSLKPGRALKTVAIIDADLSGQRLLHDMRLAQAALRARGVETLVCDIAALSYRNGRLFAKGIEINLVYNRHTDFDLIGPMSADLRRAWTEGATVVAPNPDVYAVYADKQRLVELWDLQAQEGLQLPWILPCEVCNENKSELLWNNRRNLVFKPRNGFGSRGVARGDKITRRRFEDAVRNGFMAQGYAPPVRIEKPDGSGRAALKADLRVWAHGHRPLFVGARVYRGQLTSKRSPDEGLCAIVWRDHAEESGERRCHV